MSFFSRQGRAQSASTTPSSNQAPEAEPSGRPDLGAQPARVARVSAVAAARAAIEERARARIAELEAARGAAERQLRAELEALEVSARAADRARAAELVRDARAALEPMAARWREAPSRTLAGELARQLVDLRAREARECVALPGTGRAVRALGFALVDEIAKTRWGVLVTYATSDQPATVEALARLERALSQAEPSSAECYDLVRNLEAVIEDMSTRERREPDDRVHARWQLVREQDSDALRDFDEQHRRADQARFEASYVAPAPSNTLARTRPLDPYEADRTW